MSFQVTLLLNIFSTMSFKKEVHMEHPNYSRLFPLHGPWLPILQVKK